MDGVGQLDAVPAEVDAVLADVLDAEAGDDSEGEGAVDQATAEAGLFAVVAVVVNLVGVVGEQGEANVVVLGDGAAEAAAVDVAGREVFEETAGPAGLDRGHDGPPGTSSGQPRMLAIRCDGGESMG